MRYVYRTKVLSIEEKKERVNYRKKPGTDEVDYDERSLGWFVRYERSSAIWFGGEKPDIKVGDTLKITVEVDRGEETKG